MAQNEMPRNIAPDGYRKLYVQRDYSHGLIVSFSTDFPGGLENKIEREVWIKFINELNQIYADAEKVSSASGAECILGFLTCYLTRLCLKSAWEKRLNEVSDFLSEVNNKLIQRGVFVCDPIQNGLRVLEVILLNEQKLLPEVHDVKSGSDHDQITREQRRATLYDILLVESDFFFDDSHFVIQRLSRPVPPRDVSLEEILEYVCKQLVDRKVLEFTEAYED